MDEKLLKRMFNTTDMPAVGFGLREVAQKAQALAGKLSISGVQPKLSMKLDKKNNALIPVAQGGEYILKPQTMTFPDIPQNEQCCMDIAEGLGIDVPSHCLVRLKDGSPAYIVKRFDRVKGVKIHQEDFYQIVGPTDKYAGSVEQIGTRLREVSTAPGYDVQLYFERVVFNFLIGNGDSHLKNYSVSFRDKDTIRLTPAYDIVCSKLVIEHEEDSALTINGKKNKLKRDDFDVLAEYLNVPLKVRYDKFENSFDTMKSIINKSEMQPVDKKRFVDIIRDRFSRMRLA